MCVEPVFENAICGFCQLKIPAAVFYFSWPISQSCDPSHSHVTCSATQLSLMLGKNNDRRCSSWVEAVFVCSVGSSQIRLVIIILWCLRKKYDADVKRWLLIPGFTFHLINCISVMWLVELIWISLPPPPTHTPAISLVFEQPGKSLNQQSSGSQTLTLALILCSGNNLQTSTHLILDSLWDRK